MQIKLPTSELATRSSAGIETQSAIAKSAILSRNWLIWTVLLSFLAVTKSWADELPDFSSLVENEGAAVVKISVVTSRESSAANPGFDLDQVPESLRRFFEQFPQEQQPAPRRGQGFGSGFVVSQDGYIITNAHVVDNAADIRVGLQNRREYKAELIGADKATDIALLKVDATGLPVVRQGNSDDVKVGQWVLAIGSPFGFEYSATQGIVSAVARNLPADTYVPFIQTDVAVNPGNSGGPLFNTDGEVIGVNSQIYSRSGGYQGLSFAIPINVARGVAEQLKTKGYASRGWLGVMIQDVDQALAESFGLVRPTGALIASVTDDSPADKAGLKSGDIIIDFNDRAVSRSGKLPPMVGAVSVGTTVPLTVLRDGQEKVFDVTIEELDTGRKVASAEQVEEDGKLGLVVGALTAEQKKELDIDGGVLIEKVIPDSPAAEAGLQPGDVVESLDRENIADVEDFAAKVAKLPAGKSFPILLQRNGTAVFRAIQMPDTRE